MRQPFEIKFEFPVAHSSLTISLKATAELHDQDAYYIINNFSLEEPLANGNGLSVLPAQEIKLSRRGNKTIWVHKDSDRESLLSLAIGEAIEKVFKLREDATILHG